MSNFGKPDANGRSSGKHNGRRAKNMKPPKGVSWVWLTLELITSDAWRFRGSRCAKFIDFLLADHAENAGQENGALKATYDQLEAWGIRRASIRETIAEAEMLGLVRVVKRGGRWNQTNQPSLYRLTILGCRDGLAPSNEWKSVTKGHIDAWHRRQKELKAARKSRKKQLPSSKNATTVVTLVQP